MFRGAATREPFGKGLGREARDNCAGLRGCGAKNLSLLVSLRAIAFPPRVGAHPGPPHSRADPAAAPRRSDPAVAIHPSRLPRASPSNGGSERAPCALDNPFRDIHRNAALGRFELQQVSPDASPSYAIWGGQSNISIVATSERAALCCSSRHHSSSNARPHCRGSPLQVLMATVQVRVRATPAVPSNHRRLPATDRAAGVYRSTRALSAALRRDLPRYNVADPGYPPSPLRPASIANSPVGARGDSYPHPRFTAAASSAPGRCCCAASWSG